MTRPLILGAVAYDPKVVTIWEGFKAWFATRGLAMDTVLYTTYERQVGAHLAGHLDVAWNSPLAWLQTVHGVEGTGRTAEALVMRDTDRDLTSVIVVRADSPVRTVQDLRGRVVAVGAPDSPQATLLPLEHLAEAGLTPHADFTVQPHDLLRGKHGDHVGGEREAARALVAGTADAACMIDGNHLAFRNDGTLPVGATRILVQTGAYDHCVMTALSTAPREPIARLRELLLGMSYDDATVRPLLDMEGLKTWLPGRTEGYAPLARAVARFNTLREFPVETW